MSIRQQIIATKAYREQKLWENVDETNCRVCCDCQEIVPQYTTWLLQHCTDTVGQA